MKKYFLLFIFLATIATMSTTPVNAAAGFNAGRIIDDAVFTDKSSMSTNDIQTFLNSKVPTCDTWGTQPSEFGGGTRRQWGEARGLFPPYVCLKDYTENSKSAAQIIYDVAQEFAINPQVLIVLLQKEQGLVTDTWPTSTQYKTATGYGCPDTAPCDSQYFGLTNQLRWSGRMFRAILDSSPTWYTPYVLGDNYIQYNPTASCGGSTVNIQNRSTQALYNYTPYQPNQAALDAGWGTASCGAYGNRNFYLYFTSWFGESYQAFSSMTTPRWMQMVNDDTYKYNIFTGEQTEGPFTKDVQILGASKITIDGTTYIRTQHDTQGNLSQGIKLSDLQEIPYTSMSYPRWMKMNRDGYKQLPRLGYNIDELLLEERAVQFDQKITINNTVYLRSSHDSALGNDKAVPLIFLKDATFEPLLSPRWMKINESIPTINPNNNNTVSTAPSDMQIFFASKLQLNNRTYLRSKEDTETDTWAAIDIKNASENSFVNMVVPRTMTVNVNTTKFDTRTTMPVNAPLSNGQDISFKSKIYVNGEWYLRTEVDSNNNINYGIPLSQLSD